MKTRQGKRNNIRRKGKRVSRVKVIQGAVAKTELRGCFDADFHVTAGGADGRGDVETFGDPGRDGSCSSR